MAACCSGSVACSPDPTALNPLMIGGGRGFNGNWETTADHHFPSALSTALSYLLRHRFDDFLAPLELLLIRLQLLPQFPDALNVLRHTL